MCTSAATQVHHLDGVKAGGIIVPPDRLVAACQPCNNKVGDPMKTASALVVGDPTRFLPVAGPPGQPALSFSLSPQEALRPRDGLGWDPAALEPYKWLRGLLEVPEDAAPPLYMSEVPADAVGSYGESAIEWIERTQNLRLRHWQKLAITRQLEHRADGTLCHRVVLESAPRRAGKSVRLRAVALWRMAHPELFGEVQTVIHTGSDLAIVREIQRGAWRWSEEVAGWTITRANGKEQIETQTGDRWLARAQTAVYGYDCTYGLADECWDVKPESIDEGLEPATLERLSPQLHLTSTAHRRATSLMKSRLTTALTTESDETLLLLWGAPDGADPGDPEVWRAASPHWSEDRRKMIAAKYAKAYAGEADPQADDPDPMAGFCAQYLNMWQLGAVSAIRGNPVVSEADWGALATERPAGVPDAAAVESWFGDGVSLALAWRSGDQVIVTAEDFDSLAAAREALRASGFTRPATVGASLLEEPEFKGVRTRKGVGRTGAVVQDLGRLLAEGVLLHDGSACLSEQVLAARTLPGADGPRMASTARADALKAAVWAATDCRRRKASGGLRVITATE